MATAQVGAVQRVFDRVRQSAGGHGDTELLARFLAGRDQAAFGQLVRRHGPMVLGVCRRVLGDAHAAEDAFQATFLVLSRKADAVRPPGVLGAWLYGVAYRTALKARGREYRRRQVEQDYARNRPHTDEAGFGSADLRPVIDQQLNALPEKYRLPLVLCGVQGLGKAEAAQRLGLPEGTVSSRLARAREMLRDRLTRRGVVVPAAAVGAVLTPASLRAAIPPGLSEVTTEVAVGLAPVAPNIVTLTHEVLTAMTLSKWKLLSALAVAVALTGSGLGLYATADEKKPVGEKPAAEKPVKPGEKPARPRPDGEKPKPTADKPGEKPAKPRPDGEKGVKKPGRMIGKVGKVDASAGMITLIRKGDAGPREDVLKVAADADVTVDGRAAKLADLKPDMNVEALVAGEGGAATKVAASGQRLTGVVKAFDAAGVTIGGKEGKPADRTVKFAPGARVVIDGKESKPADLQLGDRATVVMAADDSAAVLVTVSTKGDADKPKPGKPGAKPKPEGDKPAKPRPEGDRPAKPAAEKPGTKPAKPAPEKSVKPAPEGEKTTKPAPGAKPAKPAPEKSVKPAVEGEKPGKPRADGEKKKPNPEK